MEAHESHQDHAAMKARNLSDADRRFVEANAAHLADSTRRARWINSPDEHEERPGQTLATRSHDVIRHWAGARDAKPATVPGTEHERRPGVLRFVFAGQGASEDSDRLAPISWEEWLKTFDARELVFLFQERQADSSQSNFFRFDSPRRDEA
jgi:hypothetical protein